MISRPMVLRAVVIAAGVLGLLALIEAAGWWGASDVTIGGFRAHLERVLAIALLIVAVLEFIVAWAVWSLRSWAWPVALIVQIALIVPAVLRFGNALFLNHVVTILLAGTVLVLLFTPELRKALSSSRSA